jgi:hypothetical protein
MTNPIFTAEAFGELAGTLIGKPIRSTKVTAVLPAANVRGVATYIDAEGVVTFVAVTDAAFIASVGAALAMIPLPVVEEAIRTGKPAEGLVENAYEVLNIAASLFNEVEGATTHVKVQKLIIGPMTPEVVKRMARPAARLDLAIGVPGYPDGKLAFVALGPG